MTDIRVINLTGSYEVQKIEPKLIEAYKAKEPFLMYVNGRSLVDKAVYDMLARILQSDITDGWEYETIKELGSDKQTIRYKYVGTDPKEVSRIAPFKVI